MNKSGVRGSFNYVGTAHVNSASDMLELQTIRDVVKVINKEAKFNGAFERYRVKCQGRGPRASVAIAEGRHPRTYDRSLPLSKAERLDVYIYSI